MAKTKPTYQELERQVDKLKEANKKVELSERKLKAALESMSDAVFISDTKGNFINFNQAFATFHKFKNKNECEKNLNSYPKLLDVYFPNGELASVEQWVVSRALRGETGINEEFTLVRKDINEKWVGSYNFSPIHDSEGQIIGSVVTARDITHKKKTHSELIQAKNKAEENEKIYRALFNSIPDTSILLFDKDLRYIEVAGDEVEKSGFDKSLIKGQTLQEAYPKDVVDLFEPLLQKGFKGKATTFEMQYAQFTYLQQIIPISDDSGNIFATMQIATNITEKHKAEQALKNSENLLRKIIDSSIDYIFVKDKELKTILCNKTFAQAFNKQPSDLIGKTDIENGWDAELVKGNPAKGIKGYEYYDLEALSGKIVKNIDTANISDITYYFDSIKIPLKDENDEIFGLLGISRDITERVQAENALKERDAYFKTLFNFSPDYFNIVRLRDNKIIAINDNFANQFGDTPEDIIGKTTTELNIWVKPEERHLLVDETNKKGYCSNFEAQLRRKNNSIFTGIISTKIFDFYGEPHILVVTRDISELKKNEIIIKQQNIELKKLNADKDRFISILAHDLKSPFSSILGFLDLLTRNVHKYDIDKIKKQINYIHKSAQNTYKLLEDILMWIRVSSEKISFKPQEMDLETIFIEVIESVQVTANNKNITVNNFAPGNIRIFADKYMLTAVLRNLISNAIKFTDNGGKIDVFAEKESNSITISVSDNGIGIKPEILNKLFDITQYVSTNGTANESGTGIGLLLCKELIEKHDGKIWVVSEFGKGSTFKFMLPIN